MAFSDIKNLAKQGDYAALRRIWDSGPRFDLAKVFAFAVADYRSIKRKPSHMQILRFCLDQGLAIDRTRVCTAAKFGNAEIVQDMRRLGLPEDPFVAASTGDLDGLQACAANQSLADLYDGGGYNLLHACAGSGLGRSDESMGSKLSEMCRYLIAEGVSTTHAVEDGVVIGPALSCAWFGGNAEIMGQILDQGGVQVADMHLELEFTLEPHQRSGAPFYNVAEILLERGFDLNSIRPSQGRTLLHGSSNRGAKTAVSWLLEKGANPNALDREGRRPLHVAAERNTHTSVIALLVEAGADPSATDPGGLTALEIARACNRKKVVAFLS